MLLLLLFEQAFRRANLPISSVDAELVLRSFTKMPVIDQMKKTKQKLLFSAKGF
jgi:hypothetical protein